MRCSTARNFIAHQIDGRSSPANERALRAHLANCNACQAYSHQMRALNTSLTRDARHLQTMVPSSEFSHRLRIALAQEELARQNSLLGVLQTVLHAAPPKPLSLSLTLARTAALAAGLWLLFTYVTPLIYAPVSGQTQCRFRHMASFSVRTTTDKRVYAALTQRAAADLSTTHQENLR